MNTVLVYCILVLSTLLVKSQESLRLVHVFFRHGSRTPEIENTYPTDPHTLEAFLPMGYGQLTNSGKQNSYQLGKMLRNRYNSFLGEIYTSGMVEAVSTDYDRTKMSALLVLAGLFPPHPSQQWDEELPWQPIPYNFDKEDHDYFIRRPYKYCPAYLNAFEEATKTSDQQNLTRQYQDVFEYLARESGRRVTSLLEAMYIYQTLYAEEIMNLTLPKWTNSIYPEPITTLTGLYYQLENYNDVLRRLNGGRPLKKVIEQMNAAVTGDMIGGKKIYLYSGHEANVINILAALNVYTPHVPKYSSAAIIELHHYPEKQMHGVKVFYAKELGQPPIEMKLPGCDEDCSLSTFLEVTRNHIPGNYTEECQSTVDLGD